MQIRLGLCCIFREQSVRFRHLTAASLAPYSRSGQLEKLNIVALYNAETLLEAVKTVHSLGIGAFRIMSQILPLYTHPQVGYELGELASAGRIAEFFAAVRDYARRHDIRLSFHPDQFVILASPHSQVVRNSVRELQYQSVVAEMVGADNVNIHLGGVYGNKEETKKRFAGNFKLLPGLIKKHLTLENDDRSYTPEDLYPLCMEMKIPMVYDVHHHRCNPDNWSVEQATKKSIETFKQCSREPHFHISSPKNSWQSDNPRPHHDYIDINDYPNCWRKLDLPFTVDVEAKAKELAVLRLQKNLGLIQEPDVLDK